MKKNKSTKGDIDRRDPGWYEREPAEKATDTTPNI